MAVSFREVYIFHCQHVKAKAQPGNFVSATDRVGVWDPGNPVILRGEEGLNLNLAVMVLAWHLDVFMIVRSTVFQWFKLLRKICLEKELIV